MHACMHCTRTCAHVFGISWACLLPWKWHHRYIRVSMMHGTAPLLLVVLLRTLVPCHGHKFVHPLPWSAFTKPRWKKLGECAAFEHCQTSIQQAFLQRNSTCMSLCYSCACSCSSPDDSITVTASPDLPAVSGSWVTVTYYRLRDWRSRARTRLCNGAGCETNCI